ncbi:MAG: tyrosine-type recombinase/integrase [Lachnospiraceae bacterium]|nr:tyrosine-type recombinase/integrase [Lachnospiraceae bacterium]
MKEINYHEKQNMKNINKLRELEAVLPAFVKTFFRGIEQITQPRTRIAYAEDLKVFFDFIKESNPEFKGKDLSEMKDPAVLERFTAEDIEEFLDYLKLYENPEGKTFTNSEAGIKRKISSLRAMYNYYHTHKIINENPTLQVRVPKIHEKNIIRMDPNEVVDFLDTVESGKNLSKQSMAFHEKNKVRDLALTTLLLGTGIRVSELVGLDLKDLDMENDRINIIRKGGNESFVYFGDEVHDALMDYLEERKKIIPETGSENALFLSSRKKRMCVRNVEFMVKKYAKLSVSSKKITPHKLRSTYGTQLYTETGDIYLVAEVLGHKDVNTTKRHYAAINEERRRSAKDAVKLREK